MIYRCPVCRTRRHDQALLTRHLVQSGHDKPCSCSGYAYPHRPGSPLCVTRHAKEQPPPPKRKRGRPAKPDALTPAQRAARYRARKAAAKPKMYRHKGQTWAGLGQQPRWVRDYVAEHGRLPDFS